MTSAERKAEAERKRNMGKETAARLEAAPNAGAPANSRNPDTTTENNLDAITALPEQARENGASPERVKQLEAMVFKLAGIVEGLQKREAIKAPTLATTSEEASRIAQATTRLQCPACGQFAEVCNGEHVILNIRPMSPEVVRNFAGVTLNGRRYVGRCTVAKCQVDLIMNMLNRQMCAEKDLTRNCGRMFNVATITEDGRPQGSISYVN